MTIENIILAILGFEEMAKECRTSRMPVYALDYTTEDDISTAIEALKRQAKYHWHDLRKNPEDLPEDDGYYEVMCNELCRWDNTKRLFIICMSYKHKLLYGKPIGWGYSFPYDFDFDTDEIIAWRYIEPFEVSVE